MTRHSGIKISTLFVVLATLASANSNGIWDGYALPHAAAQPNAGHTPGSYKAWLDNVRPQRRDPSAYAHLPNRQMRNALGGGQEEYTTYESNEPKYTDTSVEPYTTEEVQPTYEAHPVYSTAVYKSTEPSACPAPVEPITVTVTCTVTEPAPPPVTVTFVSTATETVTITEEVEPTTQVYYNSYNIVAPYSQSAYFTTTPPVYNAPVYTAPVYTAPVYTAPVYTPVPVYTAPVYTAPVYAASVYNAPVYTAPIYTTPPPPVYTPPPPPVYTPPPPPVYTPPPPPPVYTPSSSVPSTSPYYSPSSPYYSPSSSYYSPSSSYYSPSPSPYSPSSSAPTSSAVGPTYTPQTESTIIITVTHTSVSTATYTSIYDNISDVTMTETTYPVTKKGGKPKKGKKAVQSQLIKAVMPSNPWIRVVPTLSPTRHLADGDEGDEIVHRGQARVSVETGSIMPEYAGDIGFQLMHQNLRRNA